MFNSVKDKIISVVQENIDLETVKKRISKVQEHALGVSKSNSKYHLDKVPTDVNLEAGSELLTKYKNEWNELHENAETNAKLAEEVDSTICQIHTRIASQLDSFVHVNTLLSTLPQVTSLVNDCIVQIHQLAAYFEMVENELIALEDMNETVDFQRRQLEHSIQLTMYKEKKLDSLEKVRINLANHQTGSARAQEMKQRDELKARQKAAHDAFLKDINLYKSQGTLPKIPKEPKIENESLTLEEIQLDTGDDNELDDFLNK